MPQIRVFLPDGSQPVHELPEETLTIGRLADNAIQIEDGSVSSHHGEIAYLGDGTYELRDNGSTNGTFVNGGQITAATLNDGDKIRFGSVEATFASGVAPAGGGGQPLPQAERTAARLGNASARPPGFSNASPFPKPKPKTDPITIAAVLLAVLGAIGFAASVFLSLQIQPPA